MATHKLGKLKFNASKDGLAFRFGDGQVHRLGFRLGAKGADTQPEESAYGEDAYSDDGYDSPEYDDARGGAYDDGIDSGDYADDGRSDSYSGRFSDENGDYDDRDYDDYDDRDYDDRDYDDYDDRDSDDRDYDNYDERGGSRFDDGYDGYDDRYDTGSYDDRYSDEDAREGYDDGYSEESGLMRYVDENDWVTYVLLFLLPPLGIYLLWRRRRFEKPLRWAVTAASAAWFVILLILIISAIRSGSNDLSVSGSIAIITPTPAAAVEATVSAGSAGLPTGGPDDEMLDRLTPDATPLPSGASAANAGTNGSTAGESSAVDPNETVYITATGAYYHREYTCSGIETGAQQSKVTTSVAIARGKSPCPICYLVNQKKVYATPSGKYYHENPTCSDMKDAAEMTEEAAKNAGKKACPVCILHEVNSLSKQGLKFADKNTTDKSGITVWATSGGAYFHTNSSCSGMSGAKSGKLLDAMLLGKTACPKCCPTAGKNVYCTKNGKSYHAKSDCSGMHGAQQVTLAEALALGKKRCTTCIPDSVVPAEVKAVEGSAKGGSDSKKSSSKSDSAAKTTSLTGNGGTVYVYGTPNGKYYHTNSTCSGMQGATRYTLKSMVQSGRKACPKCCTGSNTTVYASDGGKYYHSYATCSGMTNAKERTLAEALAGGYKKCPDCWKSSSSAKAASNENKKKEETQEKKNTEDEKENRKEEKQEAQKEEQKVYCTKNGTYYHTKKNCSGMRDADHVTISKAKAMGKKACPICASGASKSVYSTKTGRYYHATENCSGMRGAKKRTVEEAKTLGQSACPVCLGGKFVVPAATVAAPATSAKAAASAKTFSPATPQLDAAQLPAVTKQEFLEKVAKANLKSSGRYKSGTSGIKVYATVNGKSYHTSAVCAGSGAVKVTLETAMNYGKTACSKCAASANTTVYAVFGSKYYHYSKACAGTGAVSGSRAAALAMGAEPCPYCVTRTKRVNVSSNTYKSGTSGIKVYAALTGKYFHTNRVCAGANASTVTLETALNYGKSPCPSCAASAGKTVYASPFSKYYHSSKSCAGSGAASGSFAKALAIGLKECPVCIGGSEAYEVSDIKYSMPAATPVYINLNSDMLYYHRTSNCSPADMKKGQGVTLEFVLQWGYKPCPFCAPPTSIK